MNLRSGTTEFLEKPGNSRISFWKKICWRKGPSLDKEKEGWVVGLG
jgi:hypothetical protein